MLQYMLRRLGLMVPTVVGASIVVFALVRFMPGSAIDAMVADTPGDQVTVDRLKERFGLDRPVLEQYMRWVGNISVGDFGTSFRTGQPIRSELMTFMPASVELGMLSLALAVVVAIPTGVVAALFRDGALDYGARGLAVLALATPAFWIGILVITWPSIWWGWSPPIHYVNIWEDPLGNLSVVWIPAAILGLHITGGFIRFTRTAVLEVMRQDYVRTAWAKGLSSRVVIVRHVMRNAAIPIVTLVGLQAPILLGGVVIVESLFIIPGMGRYLLTALQTRDYQVIQAVVMVLVTFVLLINLIVDMTYSWLDPRIRF